MKTPLYMVVLFVFCLSSLLAQQDTASVTYVPSLDIYLLHYNDEGIAYVDTLVPATKINPTVKCSVLFDNSNHLYTYSYTPSLLATSQQYLRSFQLFYSAGIQQVQKPNGRWDISDIPAQSNVDWSNTNIDTTGLYTDITDIGPNGSLSGFSFKSAGLPIIISSYFEGNAPGLAFTGEPPSKMQELLSPLLDFPNNVVMKSTVGPSLPPTPFDRLKFLDTLKSYTIQSRALGWISNQDTANKYTALFDSIRAQIVRGNGLAARKLLDSVVGKSVHDTVGVALTCEAYALLRFNSEYLKSHLPSVTVSSALMSGWNMISVPVESFDFRKSIIYPSGITPAYAYEHAYVLKDTLSTGVGYWLKFDASPPPMSYKGLRVDSQRVPVVAGWNMVGSVSANILKSKMRYENTGLPSSFFGYSTSGYSVAETIKAGQAYWVKFPTAGQLILGGIASIIPPLTQEQPPQLSGTPSPPVLSAPDNGSTGQSLTPTLGWEDTSHIIATSYHLQVSTSFTFSSLMYDGAGLTTTSKQISGLAYSTTYYWKVNASNSTGTGNWTDIRWFGTQAADPSPCTCCIESATSLDQFTVTDASGNKQSLFVNNAGKQLKLGLNDVEMPPAPIPGAFHARFHSNKFLENIPVGNTQTPIPLDLQNTTGSVTINWDIKPGNKITYWLTNPKTGKVRKVISGTGSMTFSSTGNAGVLIQAQATQPCP